jgi:D-alanyl-D-alanine carboxypeptidase
MISSVQNVSAEQIEEQPEIESEAAILMDSESGAILFNKNANVKMYPASLTKIATAIYAIEKGNLQDKVVIEKEATEVIGTKVYLVEGEVITLEQLIQGMLINSGNDAATAIALHLDGSIANFSINLNKFLEEKVKVHETHFTNPHGLFDEDHYTTAHDLAVITNYAMQNPEFKQIFGMKELPWDGESWDTTLITHHLLLKGEFPYEGITGGKTGYVNESKHTLATTAANENIKLTAIVLKASAIDKIYEDTQALLDYGFQNFLTEKLSKSSTFRSGSNEFFTSRDYFVTSTYNGSDKMVNDNGLMEIYSPSGSLIQTIQLDKVKETVATKDISSVNNGIDWKSSVNVFTQNTLYIIGFFGFTTAALGIRKWISNK